MQRRTFLRTVGSGLLISPTLGCRTSVVDLDDWWLEPVPAGAFRSSGRVVSGGGPLRRAAVSDGFSVTQTDDEGYFVLVAPARPDFVCVTVPSGFRVESWPNGYSSRFPTNQDQADFSFWLDASRSSGAVHDIAFLADVQVELPSDIADFAAHAVAEFGGEVRPSMIVSGGDMLFDRPGLLSAYRGALADFGLPLVHAVGNHDRDPWQPVTKAKKLFSDAFGPTYHSFDVGEVHYVVLDTVQFVDGGFIPTMSRDQIRWLAQDLSWVEPGRTVVVLAHVPLSWMERESAQAIRHIVAPYVTHYFAGHVHEHSHDIGTHFSEHIVGAVCGPWWAGPVCSDGTPRGYLRIWAADSEISWSYKSLGFPSTHQMSVRRFQDDTPSHPLVLNVWDWDHRWTLQWWEDGASRGAPVQSAGYDPLAWQLYQGPETPVRRPALEPSLTEHRFLLPIRENWRDLRVRAVDAFGREYFHSVNRAASQRSHAATERIGI